MGGDKTSSLLPRGLGTRLLVLLLRVLCSGQCISSRTQSGVDFAGTRDGRGRAGAAQGKNIELRTLRIHSYHYRNYRNSSTCNFAMASIRSFSSSQAQRGQRYVTEVVILLVITHLHAPEHHSSVEKQQ